MKSEQNNKKKFFLLFYVLIFNNFLLIHGQNEIKKGPKITEEKYFSKLKIQEKKLDKIEEEIEKISEYPVWDVLQQSDPVAKIGEEEKLEELLKKKDQLERSIAKTKQKISWINWFKWYWLGMQNKNIN